MMSEGSMNTFFPEASTFPHTGHEYFVNQSIPLQIPAPNSIFSRFPIMWEYPPPRLIPIRSPSRVSGEKIPPVLYSWYITFPDSHQPEYTFHGQYLVPA